jgi:hypothetical protein
MKDTNGCKCCSGGKCGKLSVCNLGMSLGLVFGLTMMVLAYLAMVFGVGAPMVKMYSSVYAGYHASALGGIVGLLWGFLQGFVFGGLIAMFYNFCRCCCPCKTCKMDRGDK